MNFNYPIVIHKDRGSDYGVIVPDLPGCFTAADSIDEAIEMAREAIELHLEGLIDEGQVIPHPGQIEKHRLNRDYSGGTWAIVSIEPANLRLRARRVNITLPQRVLDALDTLASRTHETRSGVIVKAVASLAGRGATRALRPARRGRPQKRSPRTR